MSWCIYNFVKFPMCIYNFNVAFRISTNPNNLIDVPMARCYINAYMPSHEAFEAALSKMMGKSKFMGRLNDNVFCNRWETRF